MFNEDGQKFLLQRCNNYYLQFQVKKNLSQSESIQKCWLCLKISFFFFFYEPTVETLWQSVEAKLVIKRLATKMLQLMKVNLSSSFLLL